VRFAASDAESIQRLTEYVRRVQLTHGRPLEVLSLSGGGANGAYGAGVLYGWSERGDRPNFDVVTGVSTGALTAPFAFLGQRYDEKMKNAFTALDTHNFLDFNSIFSFFFSSSLFSDQPLRRLVETFVDDELVAAVAAEHRSGRRLLVATANLDTQDLTVWNMGAIAAETGPGATRLFRDVMIASASVPGVFPPVMIDVSASDRRFQEMHVDGSTVASFFAVPEPMLLAVSPDTGEHRANLHVLINGKLETEFEVTKATTGPILQRSLDTASKAMTRNELVAVTAFSRNNGVGLKVSHLPRDVDAKPFDFDRQRMAALFEIGRSLSLNGQAWETYRGDSATVR
jgi:hypothetical protein